MAVKTGGPKNQILLGNSVSWKQKCRRTIENQRKEYKTCTVVYCLSKPHLETGDVEKIREREIQRRFRSLT